MRIGQSKNLDLMGTHVVSDNAEKEKDLGNPEVEKMISNSLGFRNSVKIKI